MVLLERSELEEVQARNDNASFDIEETPTSDLMEFLNLYLAILERVTLERIRFKPYYPTNPGLFILMDEPEVQESMATTIDFAPRLTQEEMTLLDEEVLIDEPLPRLPLNVQPMKVRLKLGGKGKPIFRSAEDEISFSNDE